MTREEVHDLMENELRCVQRGKYCDRDCAKCPLVKEDKELIEAYGYVIKALEQEPTDKNFTKADIDAIVKAINSGWELRVNEVLDKLRSEIENYKLSEDELSDMDEDSVKWGMKIAYDIVDKYKAESEEE